MNVQPEQRIYIAEQEPTFPQQKQRSFLEDEINEQPYVESDTFNQEIIFQKMRIGFIRKVYGILSVQLLITSTFVVLTFLPPVAFFVQMNIELFYLALCTSFGIIIMLICFPELYRTVPINYIMLFIWTVCESYLVGTASSFYPPEIVLVAAGLTTVIVLTLTVYSFTTETDFTVHAALLYSLSMVLFLWGLFILIFGFFLYTLYCVLGVILFSVYLIFDTQLIIGKYGKEYGIDDYIIAALNIYIDIIQIFLFLLQILGRPRD